MVSKSGARDIILSQIKQDFVTPANAIFDYLDIVEKALSKLDGKEAIIIQLYFVEELNIYEIAEVMEVTTGRVSQIKTSAIKKIREKLKKVI